MSIPAPDPTLVIPEDLPSFEKTTDAIRRRIGLAGSGGREATNAHGVTDARGGSHQDAPGG